MLDILALNARQKKSTELKKNILIALFFTCINIGCATQNSAISTSRNLNVTEEDCKKMLGLKTYNLLNEIYNDPTAAMLQCKFKLEGKVR